VDEKKFVFFQNEDSGLSVFMGLKENLCRPISKENTGPFTLVRVYEQIESLLSLAAHCGEGGKLEL
jgi:hypothetical protein